MLKSTYKVSPTFSVLSRTEIELRTGPELSTDVVLVVVPDVSCWVILSLSLKVIFAVSVPADLICSDRSLESANVSLDVLEVRSLTSAIFSFVLSIALETVDLMVANLVFTDAFEGSTFAITSEIAASLVKLSVPPPIDLSFITSDTASSASSKASLSLKPDVSSAELTPLTVFTI